MRETETKKSEIFVLSLISIMAISSLSLIMINIAHAQSILTPSMPEFTIKLSDSFSDVNVSYPTIPYSGYNYSIDSFTGENITHPNGILNVSLDLGNITLTIKNQPLVPYADADGHIISLYYNVRFKGHYADDWTNAYNSGPYNPYLKAANSDYTVVTYKLGDPNGLTFVGITPFYGIPPNGQVDFQVQSMIGYTYPYQSIQAYAPYTFSGEISEWSNTETVTAGNYSILPTLPPSVPEFSWLMILPLFFSTLSIAVIIRSRRISEQFDLKSISQTTVDWLLG